MSAQEVGRAGDRISSQDLVVPVGELISRLKTSLSQNPYFAEALLNAFLLESRGSELSKVRFPMRAPTHDLVYLTRENTAFVNQIGLTRIQPYEDEMGSYYTKETVSLGLNLRGLGLKYSWRGEDVKGKVIYHDYGNPGLHTEDTQLALDKAAEMIDAIPLPSISDLQDEVVQKFLHGRTWREYPLPHSGLVE